MKNFLEKIKALLAACFAWLNKWPKDLLLHFSLADNIAFVTMLLGTPLIAITGREWPAWLFSAFTTSIIIFYKQKGFDIQHDWRDIAAGYIGACWAWTKFALGYLFFRWLLC